MQEPQQVDIKQVIDTITSACPELSPEYLQQYIHEILRWNPRIGLVSRQDTVSVISRLVRQSLHLLELVRPRTEAACGKELHVVDVGSGGGFPGLVWAMVEPDWRFLLVERRHKKAAFLERIVKVLGLADVEVYAGAAQEAQTITRFAGRFDAATTMAVGRPVKTATLVEGFLRAGRIFATTVPRDEPKPRENVGTRMRLLETDSDDESLYVLYMKQ